MRPLLKNSVLALAATIATAVLPVAAMQVVLVVLAWASGALVAHLGGGMPASVLVDGALGVVAALPLVALQSLLAMVLRSFGAPVALGLLGTMVGLVLSYVGTGLGALWPHSLATRALTLGTSTLSTTGGLDWAGVAPVLRGTVITGIVFWGLLVLVARRGASSA